MEVAAFWIGLAAVIIAGSWYRSRSEAQKHQTFRTIVEKTGNVDEEQLRLLITPPRSNPWEPGRGDSYRFLRGAGAILMFLGGGGLLFGGVLLLGVIFAPSPSGNDGPGIFMALGFGALVLGAGIFYSSRFAEKPAAESERPGPWPHKE
ncbi:MAG TPA: hypothetical protein VFX89_15395 [Gammaproteobacteria bacterium]|nr:hypothetical protein [Gammaproteobacteria bacterium]